MSVTHKPFQLLSARACANRCTLWRCCLRRRIVVSYALPIAASAHNAQFAAILLSSQLRPPLLVRCSRSAMRSPLALPSTDGPSSQRSHQRNAGSFPSPPTCSPKYTHCSLVRCTLLHSAHVGLSRPARGWACLRLRLISPSRQQFVRPNQVRALALGKHLTGNPSIWLPSTTVLDLFFVPAEGKA